jgi:hypothetical protein
MVETLEELPVEILKMMVQDEHIKFAKTIKTFQDEK